MTDLSAFVPRLAAELGATPDSHWTSVPGSMLSADISGFTALSEKLAGKGKAGAEEITELINTCFTALIDSAYDYGGEVLKFGGDALLVLFRGDDHERRVVSAGQAMQHALHSSPAAKRANLTMTVGAAEGPFDVFLAGSDYRELLITGTRATEVIHLEGEAAKGETLVSPTLAAVLPPDMVGRTHAGGHEVIGRTDNQITGPPDRVSDDLDLSSFVPPAVLEQFVAFEEMGGEHRLVTVGFAMVAGIAAEIDRVGADGTAATLGRLVDDIMAATAPFGVTVLHTDIAPDGVKFVLCAGAPVNPGDTGDALLEAALRIAEIDSPLVIRQGVQTGRVFAGFLGSPYRRTYTLMGDPVNTAARMLGKADDRDIVAVDTVVDDTRTIFATEELEPFHVKGKTEPIVAHKVFASSDEVRRHGSATRLVGRKTELDSLTRAIGELGEVIVLSGPAGVGKSRLLDAAWDMAEGLTIFQAACTPYGASSPYSVFRPLLRSGSGIDVHADPDHAGDLLTKIVRSFAPALRPVLPLLAIPFGAKVSSTPEFEAIEPKFLRERVHAAVVDFLDAVLDGPVMLVVEDLHWVDDASGDLVSHLVRAAESRPWAAIVTRRPEGEWVPPESAHLSELALDPLDDDDIRSLAIQVCARALTDHELDEIAARAAGNPLFAIELTAALDGGSVDALPDSIEGMIATRIDSLDPAERRLVRLASVFGQTFAVADFTAVLTDVAPELTFRPKPIADLLEPGRNKTMRFTHALYRDVAYEGLPFRRRTRLHATVGRSLEDRAKDPDAIAGLLSLHFAEARVREKAWHYSLIAGERAASTGANIEAAATYRRALDSAPRSVDPGERAEVSERLGDAAWSSGKFEDAVHALQRVRRLSTDEAVDLRARRKIGMIRENEGRQTQALSWYTRALRTLDDRQVSPEVEAERGHLLIATAGIRHRQADDKTGLALAEEAERIALRIDDASVLASALDRQVLARTFLKQDLGGRGEAALAAYRALGNSAGEARTLNNMGIASYFAGDWTSTVDLYASAIERSTAAGDVLLAGIGAVNMAEILADQGYWDRAIEALDDVVRNWMSTGYGPGVAVALSFRGTARSRRGDDDAASDLEESLDRATQIGASSLVAGAVARLAEHSLIVDNLGDAQRWLDQLASMPEAAESDLTRRRRLFQAILDNRRSNEVSDDLIELAYDGGDFVQALAEHLLHGVAPELVARDERLASQLGIIAFPPFPVHAVTPTGSGG
ncbi:MAG: AAA family ATPase [Acidimicrobiales bacterium]